MATARILEPPEMPVYRLTVEQYRQMVETGILDEDDNVELLEGVIVPKMSKNPLHVISVGNILDLLIRLLPIGWFLNAEQPIDTLDSEPEPDFAIVRGKRSDYETGHPTPADVGLVIEVANTTLFDDRRTKLRIYARAGIPFYWIVNLIDRQVEVYSQPYTEDGVSGYRQRADFAEGAAVVLILDDKQIAQINVAEMLP